VLKYFSVTPPENSGGAEDSTKNSGPHAKNFFCSMYEMSQRHPVCVAENHVNPCNSARCMYPKCENLCGQRGRKRFIASWGWVSGCHIFVLAPHAPPPKSIDQRSKTVILPTTVARCWPPLWQNLGTGHMCGRLCIHPLSSELTTCLAA
jgi:hypothetical protein